MAHYISIDNSNIFSLNLKPLPTRTLCTMQLSSVTSLGGEVFVFSGKTHPGCTRYTTQVQITEEAGMLRIYPVHVIKIVFCKRDSAVHLLSHSSQLKLWYIKVGVYKYRFIAFIRRSTKTE